MNGSKRLEGLQYLEASMMECTSMPLRLIKMSPARSLLYRDRKCCVSSGYSRLHHQRILNSSVALFLNGTTGWHRLLEALRLVFSVERPAVRSIDAMCGIRGCAAWSKCQRSGKVIADPSGKVSVLRMVQSGNVSWVA